ncbi:MAG: endo-1,4-beta-xylanase [Leptolyngbyaceae cyanobacterium SL_7_1]|nr:endo-1,4-beta-xylanase [Leptolyngbyaceae cyanobacterium SL_7_1]
MMFTRRQALQLGVGATAAASSVAIANSLSKQSQLDLTDVGNASLRERAAAKGILYGAAIEWAELSDSGFNQQILQECNILVAENEFKFGRMRPSLDRFDFTASDRLLGFARRHSIPMRGHTLVWHLALPDWFEEQVNRRNAEQVLTNHIQTVAGRYRGQIHSWDVVNEAIEPSDGRRDRLRRTPWLERLGDGYIELAFQAAAAADPEGMLVYNELGLEGNHSDAETRRRKVVELLAGLIDNGVPVHALGIQSHLTGGADYGQFEHLRPFLSDVASLGLQILVTELDVSDQHLPADLQERDRQIATLYHDYLAVLLDEAAVIAVLTWGLSDRYTWLSSHAPRQDGNAVRPLPLDDQLNRKQAWNAIARALDQAPPR